MGGGFGVVTRGRNGKVWFWGAGGCGVSKSVTLGYGVLRFGFQVG